MWVPTPHGIALCALLGGLVLAAYLDLRVRRIPNPLNLALAAGGVTHALWVAGPRQGLWSLAGIALGVVLLLYQFRRGLMGAGDVKLLGAIGAWTGMVGVLYVLLIGSALGGVLAVVALLRADRGERAQVGHNLVNLALTRSLDALPPARPARSIPFGVALAAAAALVVLGVRS